MDLLTTELVDFDPIDSCLIEQFFGKTVDFPQINDLINETLEDEPVSPLNSLLDQLDTETESSGHSSDDKKEYSLNGNCSYSPVSTDFNFISIDGENIDHIFNDMDIIGEVICDNKMINESQSSNDSSMNDDQDEEDNDDGKEMNEEMIVTSKHFDTNEIHNYSRHYSDLTERRYRKPVNHVGCRRIKIEKDLKLSEEEKKLLAKEGHVIFPGDESSLTKQEEKVLRKIRRKIRNKKSAQCSRQRKKLYLEDLEKKYEKIFQENGNLKREIKDLRKENESLKKMSNLLNSDHHLLPDQASFKTSLFVLFLSFVFVLIPFFKPDAFEDGGSLVSKSEYIGTGRHLLNYNNVDSYQSYGLENIPIQLLFKRNFTWLQ